MAKICFASFEIFPTTKGGAGVFVHNAASVLLEAKHEVILLLDLPFEEYEHFQKEDRSRLPNFENCRAYHVSTLCEDIPLRGNDFAALYLWNSYRFHYACSKIYKREKPDLIEFFDYSGIAFYAVLSKLAGLDYSDSRLAIRLHTSNEVMDKNSPHEVDFEYYLQYDLEHAALRLAESIVFPSVSFLEEAYKPNYPEQWFGQLCVSPPPLVQYPKRNTVNAEGNIILYYGRIDPLKGANTFVDACIAALSENTLRSCRFVLVGGDTIYKLDDRSEIPFSSYLRSRIPAEFGKNFIFTGALKWKELEELLPDVQFAVFPNRYESFCYAAHELYAAGIPLIIADLPAFRDYFKHGENALIFDHTVTDLKEKMQRLGTDRELQKKLSRPYPVANTQMGGFYPPNQPDSWISRPTGFQSLAVLCLILDENSDEEGLRDTVNCLQPYAHSCDIVILKKAAAPQPYSPSNVRFLGKEWVALDRDGNLVHAAGVKTHAALLILRSGDRVEGEFLSRGMDLLAQQPQISFVGCWYEGDTAQVKSMTTFPVDAFIELLPFIEMDPLHRCLMRTPAGQLITGVFSAQMGEFAEIEYLWRLDSDSSCGVVIPKKLLKRKYNLPKKVPAAILAYLLLRDSSLVRKARLSRYSIVLHQEVSSLTSNPQVGEGMGFQAVAHDEVWWFKHSLKTILQKRRVTRLFVLKPLRWAWDRVKKWIQR